MYTVYKVLHNLVPGLMQEHFFIEAAIKSQQGHHL